MVKYLENQLLKLFCMNFAQLKTCKIDLFQVRLVTLQMVLYSECFDQFHSFWL